MNAPLFDLSPVLRQFNLSAPAELLPGGSTRVYRAGEVVLKRIRETSLENNHSPALAAWIAAFTADLPQEGFRVPRPVPAVNGDWITSDGWTAWSFVEGIAAGPGDIPQCLAAIFALHRALKPIPRHPLMDDNRTAWGFAHRECWGEKPGGIQPELRPLLNELYALRRLVAVSACQLMHGDLSPDNLLVAPGLAPAFLDLSPFWGPPEFAAAIFANFIGPRRGDASLFHYFESIPGFAQLILRAAIRMLLVVSHLNGLDEWSSERRAAELVIEYVSMKQA
jgi:hypothetical protein